MNDKISLEIKPLSFGNAFSCAEETKQKITCDHKRSIFLFPVLKAKTKANLQNVFYSLDIFL